MNHHTESSRLFLVREQRKADTLRRAEERGHGIRRDLVVIEVKQRIQRYTGNGYLFRDLDTRAVY